MGVSNNPLPKTVADRANDAFAELGSEAAKLKNAESSIATAPAGRQRGAPPPRAKANDAAAIHEPSQAEQQSRAKKTLGKSNQPPTTQQLGAFQAPRYEASSTVAKKQTTSDTVPSNAPAWVKSGTTIEERDGKRFLVVVAKAQGPETGILSGKNLAQANARSDMAQLLHQSVLTNTRLEGSFRFNEAQQGQTWVKVSIEVPAEFTLP